MILLHNALIHTQNKKQPLASALLIDRERIIAVGNTNELFNHFPRAKGQDLGGRVIVPGLTDAHLHLLCLLAGVPLAAWGFSSGSLLAGFAGFALVLVFWVLVWQWIEAAAGRWVRKGQSNRPPMRPGR